MVLPRQLLITIISCHYNDHYYLLPLLNYHYLPGRELDTEFPNFTALGALGEQADGVSGIVYQHLEWGPN